MAANNAVGTGAIVLSASADKLMGGLVKAGKMVEGWASGLKSKLGGGIMDAMTPKGMVNRLGAVSGATIGVGEAIEKINDIAKQGDIAKAMGMTSEQFTGIAGVAKSVGEDTREFIESLVTLGKVASEGAAGKGEVAPDFFKRLNIDAKEFVKLRPDEQFHKFFEAVQGVQDPLQRTRMLMVAFGEDGGKYLLPLLSKSPQELRKMAGGLQITAEQMKQAKAASVALAEAQNAFKKIWQDIVIAAAPVFEFLAGELKTLVNEFGSLKVSATDSLEKIIRLTAMAADATKALGAATLYVTGLRLKFFQAEFVARSAMWGVEKGGPVGGGLAVTGALAAMAGMEVEMPGFVDALRTGGGLMMDMGEKMFNDIGGASKRADEFLTKLAARRNGAGAMANTVAPSAIAAAYTPPKSFASALVKSSQDAYSLELKHNFGLNKTNDPAKQQVEETKKVKAAIEKQTEVIKKQQKGALALGDF